MAAVTSILKINILRIRVLERKHRYIKDGYVGSDRPLLRLNTVPDIMCVCVVYKVIAVAYLVLSRKYSWLP